MSPVSKNTTGQLICETAATVWLSLSVSRPMHACVMVPDTARSTNQTSTFTPLPFIVFHMTSLMWDVRCVPRCANWHEMATSSYWINLSQIRLSKLCFYVMDNFCPYWGGGGGLLLGWQPPPTSTISFYCYWVHMFIYRRPSEHTQLQHDTKRKNRIYLYKYSLQAWMCEDFTFI